MRTIFLFIAALLTINQGAAAQEKTDEPSLAGIWRMYISTGNADNDAKLALSPTGFHKIFHEDGKFTNLAVFNNASLVTAYGTYDVLSSSQYVEHIEMSPNPGFIGADNVLDFVFRDADCLTLSFDQPNGPRIKEMWYRVKTPRQLNGNYDDSTPNARNETISTDERGVYFDKKTYDGAVIPVKADFLNAVPKPVLTDNSEWVSMYNNAWELAYSHIKKPQANSGFVSNYFDEAFDNTYIYQWDIIFMTMFAKYAHTAFQGINSLDNFYCKQRYNGAIARMISESAGTDYWSDDTNPNFINPPLFSWVEVETYKATGDKSRFAAVLTVLEKYFEFVETRRNSYDKTHQLFWSNGQSSGMDNTPRDGGRNNGHYSNDHVGWVDISCQMVIQCNNIATICDELGKTGKAESYRQKANDIAARINQYMWDETAGLYFDVNTVGVKTPWKTIAAFWPMLAGITTPHQDSLLIANLQDPELFWRPIPFPTLAKSHSEYVNTGGYWLGAVWAPTNFATIKGLEKVGANAFAKEATEKYLEGLYNVYLTTGTLWENYAAELINGNFKQGTNEANPPADCRKDFVGWTGLSISLLIENVLGFRMNGADKVLTYDLRRTDRHGIENLRMADVTTSIITCDRTGGNASNPVKITVITDKPYTLKVLFEGEEYVYDITAGERVIEIPRITANVSVEKADNLSP
jgi:hypothetical protein